jgi:hypothetical protein
MSMFSGHGRVMLKERSFEVVLLLEDGSVNGA